MTMSDFETTMTYKQLNHVTNERYLDLDNPTVYGLIGEIRTRGRSLKGKKSKETQDFSVINQYVGEAKRQSEPGAQGATTLPK